MLCYNWRSVITGRCAMQPGQRNLIWGTISSSSCYCWQIMFLGQMD